jgi:recombination protein RecT
MGQLTVQEERRQNSVAIRQNITRMAPEFEAALPEHITVEKFTRVVMTAVNGDPALLTADRTSLFESALKAAQDGLLPDKREGALVIYSGKVQWMPMIAGVLKKMRNSGELLTITAQVTYTNDKLEVVYGDDERIVHEPNLSGDRGKPNGAYAIGKTKDGGIYREFMTLDQIEKVRKVSRSSKGPWFDWWDEMARKTVLRRLAKRMPQSTDVERVLARDDEMYDFGRKALGEAGAGRLFSAVANPLSDEPEQIPHNAETGEIDGDWSEASSDQSGAASGDAVNKNNAGAGAGQQTSANAKRDPAAGDFGETSGAAGEAAGNAPTSDPAATDHIKKIREHAEKQAKANGARKPPNKVTSEADQALWFETYDAIVSKAA